MRLHRHPSIRCQRRISILDRCLRSASPTRRLDRERFLQRDAGGNGLGQRRHHAEIGVPGARREDQLGMDRRDRWEWMRKPPGRRLFGFRISRTTSRRAPANSSIWRYRPGNAAPWPSAHCDPGGELASRLCPPGRRRPLRRANRNSNRMAGYLNDPGESHNAGGGRSCRMAWL